MRCDSTAFDCVVVDVAQRGHVGWQVLQRLRELSDLPVLVLTEGAPEADRVRGLLSGADDHLSKPVENEELVARIEVLLARRSAALDGRIVRTASSYGDGVIAMDVPTFAVTVRGVPVSLHRDGVPAAVGARQPHPGARQPRHAARDGVGRPIRHQSATGSSSPSHGYGGSSSASSARRPRSRACGASATGITFGPDQPAVSAVRGSEPTQCRRFDLRCAERVAGQDEWGTGAVGLRGDPTPIRPRVAWRCEPPSFELALDDRGVAEPRFRLLLQEGASGLLIVVPVRLAPICGRMERGGLDR